MDEFSAGPIPDHPAWSSGSSSSGGRVNVGENRRTANGNDAENAVGLALREARIRLWADLWQGKLTAEHEVRVLRDRVAELEAQLAR